ncbi:MAG: hypothetical protein AB2693_15510, partial [Candidatus Thiodiazotropha sp.]
MAFNLFWDIWNLFWDTGILIKNYFGISPKLIKGYGIFGGNFLGIWDIGDPPKQASSYSRTVKASKKL